MAHSKSRLAGVVKFIGSTDFAAGEWIGLQLDEKAGKNNGAPAASQMLFRRLHAAVIYIHIYVYVYIHICMCFVLLIYIAYSYMGLEGVTISQL